MSPTNMFIIGLAVLFSWSGSLYGDYTLYLKNGRHITVKEYREEDGKIRVYFLGGEIEIAKVQVESIIRVVSPGPIGEGEVEEKKEEHLVINKNAKTSEELLKERGAKEEREYQERVREITGRIKVLRDRYSLATKGATGPKPSLLNSEETIRGRTADLMSRLGDPQFIQAGSSDAAARRLKLSRRGVRPRSSVVAGAAPALPPPPSAKEKELSKLRAQITQLQKERERLIEEMKRKNFNIGSLFLE